MPTLPAIAVAPDTRPAMHAAFVDAVRAGGGEVVPPEQAEALVWADPRNPSAFPDVIRRAPAVQWIQLPFAGVERFARHLDPRFVWTCGKGKGVYALPVAEHALGLMLAGLRGLNVYARADRWLEPIGRNLVGASVTVVGGGGICEELVDLLEPFRCTITIVRRTPRPMGAARVLPMSDLHQAVAGADVVLLALPLTPETTGVIDAAVLDAMQSHAWLINVARGGHVVTADLVAALESGSIGGAALDVTDPEPLPESHPLWTLPNCIVTPHIANTPEMGLPLIANRVRENVQRFAAGAELLGVVDPVLGY